MFCPSLLEGFSQESVGSRKFFLGSRLLPVNQSPVAKIAAPASCGRTHLVDQANASYCAPVCVGQIFPKNYYDKRPWLRRGIDRLWLQICPRYDPKLKTSKAPYKIWAIFIFLSNMASNNRFHYNLSPRFALLPLRETNFLQNTSLTLGCMRLYIFPYSFIYTVRITRASKILLKNGYRISEAGQALTSRLFRPQQAGTREENCHQEGKR